MFSKWPIRVKLLVGLGLLVVMVAILSGSGLYTTYAYRSLVKSLGWRVSELPLADEVNGHVSNLRVTLSELRGLRAGCGQRMPGDELDRCSPAHGPGAVSRRTGRRRRHAGGVSQAGRAKAPGGLRHGRQPARARHSPQDRSRLAGDSPDRLRPTIGSSTTQRVARLDDDIRRLQIWPPNCPATCTPS